MTTKELRARLLELDPSETMEVIKTLHSDYQEMELDDIEVVEAVKRSSACYVMRSHPNSMSPTDKANAKNFIHFLGN